MRGAGARKFPSTDIYIYIYIPSRGAIYHPDLHFNAFDVIDEYARRRFLAGLNDKIEADIETLAREIRYTRRARPFEVAIQRRGSSTPFLSIIFRLH